MNSYIKQTVKTLLALLFLGLCLGLIVIGQRKVAYGHLGLMMIGLVGILALLYLYNRSFNKEKDYKKEK